MFSTRALLLIALIGITSVLAAPTPLPGQAESPQTSAFDEPKYETSGKPLDECQDLLTGNWFRVPNPTNLRGLPAGVANAKYALKSQPKTESSLPNEWISFAVVEKQFLWYHGNFKWSTTGEIYAKHLPHGSHQWQVGQIKPEYKNVLVGYWREDKKDPRHIRIIFMRGGGKTDGKFLVRELDEKEEEWVKANSPGA